MSLTHLFFVDDVILFGLGTHEEWQGYKEIMYLLCSTTCMKINNEKSSFLYSEVDEVTRDHILSLLPYKMELITLGFKYLGYHLKPLGYCSNDWRWIIKSFEKRISNGAYRLISLGGRLILFRSVLLGLALYWFSLSWIPKSIFHCLRCSSFNFL